MCFIRVRAELRGFNSSSSSRSSFFKVKGKYRSLGNYGKFLLRNGVGPDNICEKLRLWSIITTGAAEHLNAGRPLPLLTSAKSKLSSD
jgi:hypothetical protein